MGRMHGVRKQHGLVVAKEFSSFSSLNESFCFLVELRGMTWV